MQLNLLPGAFGTPGIDLGQASLEEQVAEAVIVDPDFGKQAEVFVAADLPQFDALAVTQLADTELFGAARQFAHTGALVAHFRGINAIHPYRHALPGDRGPVANGYAQGVAVINAADFINADIAED